MLPVAIVAVCLLIQPLSLMRKAVNDEETARLQKYDADLANVPADAALWDWRPFLDTQDSTKQAKVLDSIRGIDQRQAQAEIMLDRGDFPLRYLAFFDLDPTPSLCEKARNLLRKRVEPLALKTPNSRPYSDIALQVSDAVDGMNWLVGYGCSCDVEIGGLGVHGEGISRLQFRRLSSGRATRSQGVGRILRERPERFSMLGATSHLKGWLRFADDKEFQARALADARQLNRRTEDAVEIFRDKYDEESRWKLLRYLTELDLETTVPLCANALSELHGQLVKVYRPDPVTAALFRIDRAARKWKPAQRSVMAGRSWLYRRCGIERGVSRRECVSGFAGRAEMLAALTKLRSAR